MWYISTTLLLYNLSFEVLKRELKVVPDTELGKKRMRKIVFVFILVLSAIGLNAQKIVLDKVESDGSRLLQTKYTTIYSKMVSGGALSLCCVATESDTSFYLSLMLNEQKLEIEEGRKLVVKLSDGTILTLENTKKIGPLDYEIRQVYSSIEYLVYPMYYVSLDDLRLMIDKGVVKLRIETDMDNLDRDIKKTKMSDILATGLSNIEQALTVKKDIYSDF